MEEGSIWIHELQPKSKLDMPHEWQGTVAAIRHELARSEMGSGKQIERLYRKLQSKFNKLERNMHHSINHVNYDLIHEVRKLGQDPSADLGATSSTSQPQNDPFNQQPPLAHLN